MGAKHSYEVLWEDVPDRMRYHNPYSAARGTCPAAVPLGKGMYQRCSLKPALGETVCFHHGGRSKAAVRRIVDGLPVPPGSRYMDALARSWRGLPDGNYKMLERACKLADAVSASAGKLAWTEEVVEMVEPVETEQTTVIPHMRCGCPGEVHLAGCPLWRGPND